MDTIIIKVIYVVVVLIMFGTMYRLSKRLKEAQINAEEYKAKYEHEREEKYSYIKNGLILENEINELRVSHPENLENLTIERYKDYICSLTVKLEKQIGGRIKNVRYYPYYSKPFEIEVE